MGKPETTTNSTALLEGESESHFKNVLIDMIFIFD